MIIKKTLLLRLSRCSVKIIDEKKFVIDLIFNNKKIKELFGKIKQKTITRIIDQHQLVMFNGIKIMVFAVMDEKINRKAFIKDLFCQENGTANKFQ